MSLGRREFLHLATASALVSGLSSVSVAAKSGSGAKALAFDAFAIFDSGPVAARAEALFPGTGSTIMNAWRTRQFEYQWLRSLSGQYADFLQATEEALVFTAKQIKLDLSAQVRRQLMSEWSDLKVWPDVPEAISALRQGGLRLAVLSNMTDGVLTSGLKNAHIDSYFETILSTDQIRSYKPDPRAYQLMTDRLQLPREQILFVAFAGWDVAGAKWFGYPTYWLNRFEAPAEELGIESDAAGKDLSSLVQFVLHGKS